MTYSSRAVANAFIKIAKDEDKKLSNMQLQKLVFFSHGYNLAFLGTPLTSDVVKAWTFGPVYPILYECLREYGRNPVVNNISTYDEISEECEEMKVIRSVWNAYKNYSAFELSSISHNSGSPWDKVWKTNKFGKIPNHIIKEYYKGLI